MGLKSRLAGYACALLSVAVALLLRLLIDPVLDIRIPYATFYAAVAVSAVAAGLGPAVFAAVLGGWAAVYFFLPPRHQLFAIAGADNQLGFALYLFVSALLIALAELQRRATARARREAAARQRAEAVERLERQRFEITLSSIGDGVIATDSDTRITFINKVAAALTGWDARAALGQPIESVFAIRNEETDAIVENPAVRAIREGRVVGLANHTVLISKSGERIPINDSGAPIAGAGGGIVGAVLVFQDVSSERERTRELLRLKRMIDLCHDAVIVTDSERRITVWNGGAREMYGWSETEALGKVLHSLLQTEASARQEIDRELAQNGSWDGEVLHRCMRGEEIRCESRQVLLRDPMGRVEGLLEINRDVTERKRIEEKLRESAKLESLGVLAGGIAHDFNNLLTGVLGNASLLLEDTAEGTAVRSYAQGISQAAEQAARLAHQMLAYSGRGRFVVERVDLSSYIRQTAPLLQSSIPKNVELVFDLADDLPAADADAAQLQQLVMNLVINGAEAIGPEGGRVTVATKLQLVDEAYSRFLLLEGDIRPGPYVALTVSDTGCGMSPETVPRIFEPFFTTKFVGRGLGLAAVQGIVRGHKGAIKVYSQPGKGTTFYVLLPANTSSTVNERERAQPLPPEHGAGTVLVIDDEEIVRSTANHALRILGYEVITASEGARGLDIFRSLHETISLVILDLSMPGGGGEEIMPELRKIDPAVPILLSSGFSESEILGRFAGSGIAGFLQKPYTVNALAQRIKAATVGGAAAV